jgi:hypothetical protein
MRKAGENAKMRGRSSQLQVNSTSPRSGGNDNFHGDAKDVNIAHLIHGYKFTLTRYCTSPMVSSLFHLKKAGGQ